MAITLTTRDERLLEASLRALASPLAFATLDAWRSASNRALKRLLAADMVTFDLPVAGEARLYSDEHDETALGRYHGTIAPLDEQLRIFERMQRLRVATRRMGWGRDLSRLYGSAYYNDYIVPLRCFDTLSAHARYPGLDSAATIYFHHEKATGSKFGDRGLALLRLVYPAFEAASHFCLAFGRRRERLARMADTLEQPAALYARSGRLLHRNRALRELLALEPQDRLAHSLDRLAVRTSEGMRIDGNVPSGRWTTRVTTARSRYTLRATVLGEGPGEWGQMLVTVTPRRARPADRRELIRRFGLTPRQAEVALLLAGRGTNAEIAERLVISPHTARRHTEKVLLKLGVASRRDVLGAITPPEPDGSVETAASDRPPTPDRSADG